MTISNEQVSVTVLGDGAQTVFTYPFVIPAKSYARLVLTDANGNASDVPPAAWSMTDAGNPLGGTFQYPYPSGSGIPAGSTLTLIREVPYAQITNLRNQGAYYPQSVEGALDFIAMQAQQLSNLNDHALRVPSWETTVGAMPSRSSRKNTFLGFDAAGEPTSIAGFVPGTLPVSSFVASLLSSPDSDTFLTLLRFVQDGVGAVDRSVLSKLRDVINVVDFGAVADSNGTAGHGTDNRAAFQLAADRSVATGLPFVIPAGCYRLSGSVVFNNTTDTNIVTNPRPDIRGAGSRSTVLVFDGGATAGFDIRGTEVEAPPTISPQYIGGFQMVKSDLQGVALDMAGLSHTHVADIVAYQWLYGVRCVDVQQAYWENVVSIFNAYGFLASRGNFTQPNNYLFSNCKFSANQNNGLDVQNGAVVFFSGGSIESNGGPGADALKFGARILVNNGTVVEQNLAATFSGAYFERNGGVGDILFTNSQLNAPSGISVLGCNFNRGLNTLGPGPVAGTNCIRVETSGGSLNTVTIVGCGFGGLPRSGGPGVQWSPSAGTPYIGVVNPAQPLRLVTLNNRYTDGVEAPGNFDAGPWAAAHFNGNTAAVARGQNVVGLVRNSAGNYTFTFGYASFGGPYHWTASADVRGSWRLVSYSATTLQIVFENASGVPTDVTNASVMVYN